MKLLHRGIVRRQKVSLARVFFELMQQVQRLLCFVLIFEKSLLLTLLCGFKVLLVCGPQSCLTLGISLVILRSKRLRHEIEKSTITSPCVRRRSRCSMYAHASLSCISFAF